MNFDPRGEGDYYRRPPPGRKNPGPSDPLAAWDARELYGEPLPVVYGTAWVPGRVIYAPYGKPTDAAVEFFNPPDSPLTTLYRFVSGMTWRAQVAFCQGPVAAIEYVKRDKIVFGSYATGGGLWNFNLLSEAVGDPATYPYAPTFVLGDIATAAPWSVVAGEASWLHHFAYGHVAAMRCERLTVGGTGSLPEFSARIRGKLANYVDPNIFAEFGTTVYGALPGDLLRDLLTSPKWGRGLTSATLATTLGSDNQAASSFDTYCHAMGWYLGLAITSKDTFDSVLAKVLEATNSVAVWSAGGTSLKLIPLGDSAKTRSSYTYSPPSISIGLTDDDYFREDGDNETPPIEFEIVDEEDTRNVFPIGYVNGNATTEDEVETSAMEAASVSVTGQRKADATSLPMIRSAAHALAISALKAKRSIYCSMVMKFEVNRRYPGIESADLLSPSSASMGIAARTVRVLNVEERPTGSWAIEAVEWPLGVTVTPTYFPADTDGLDYNPDAGADFALGAVAGMASDSVFSVSEHAAALTAWNDLSQSGTAVASLDLVAKATAAGVSSSAFTNAITALGTYLNAGTAWTTGTPSWLTGTVDVAIVPATWQATWAAAYAERLKLQNAITADAIAQLDAIAADGVLTAGAEKRAVLEMYRAIQAEISRDYALGNSLYATGTWAVGWVNERVCKADVGGGVFHDFYALQTPTNGNPQDPVTASTYWRDLGAGLNNSPSGAFLVYKEAANALGAYMGVSGGLGLSDPVSVWNGSAWVFTPGNDATWITTNTTVVAATFREKFQVYYAARGAFHVAATSMQQAREAAAFASSGGKIATTSLLGAVKVGSGLAIAADGTLSSTAGGGSVTNVATAAPITGGPITGTGTIGISAATSGAAGSMSAADKTKLDGVATGATANAGTVTGVTGTAPVVSSGGAAPAISMPAAASGVSGHLTASDWALFAGKVTFPGFGATGLTACVGNDARLSDSRVASDVSAWAKAAFKPGYNYSEITGTPTLGTAAAKNAPAAGNAAATEVVLGADTRMADARPANGGTATNATNAALTQDTTTASPIYVTLAGGVSGNQGLKSSNLLYTPSTGVLSLNGATAITSATIGSQAVASATTAGNVSGIVAIGNGGTGSGSAAGAIAALGAVASTDARLAAASSTNRGTVKGFTNLTLGADAALSLSNANVVAALGFTPVSASGTVSVSNSCTGAAASLSGFGNPTTAATASTIAYRDASGDLTAHDVFATSDERLKRDIVTVPDALAKVLALRGVNFTRRADPEARKKLGVIAQELRLVVPEAVTEGEDGMLAVSYGDLVGLLIEAMKAQQLQIAALAKPRRSLWRRLLAWLRGWP